MDPTTAENTYYALLGTLFTWFVTALGSSLVFFLPSSMKRETEIIILDISLGFSAGVMLAASYFSLLEPSVELSKESNLYGDYYFFPTSFGFLLGGLFVMVADQFIPESTIDDLFSASSARDAHQEEESKGKKKKIANKSSSESTTTPMTLRRRSANNNTHTPAATSNGISHETHDSDDDLEKKKAMKLSVRRIILLVLAVTIHNFPEGLAVGVGFGAIGKSPQATFEAAKILAFGIGIQNFPEGLAVSLPMRRLGYSKWRCFFYGQLSGMVEPIAGVLGAYGVSVAEPLLPYTLSFAAGAMVFVVCDSIIPETHQNRSYASLAVMVGFVVMMTLDLFL